jgi:valyl-tRNA synthetase
MTENRQISQDYIIRILQHFATKLWNITNFVMLFQAVMNSASTTARSKILLQSPKFLFPHKISLPLKRWKKSRKFRQFETNVS